MEWNVLEKLWGLFAAIAALWARLEIGQALNRAQIQALWSRRKEDRDDLSLALEQLRSDNKDLRHELREELKLLRDLIERRMSPPAG